MFENILNIIEIILSFGKTMYNIFFNSAITTIATIISILTAITYKRTKKHRI